jgi:radical S-adenosyl methionine domain-containing protein 2
MKKKQLPINFHITEACNMHCKYCFAKYGGVDRNAHLLSFQQYCIILDQVKKNNFSKISFAGGEPTLHPFLAELVQYSKKIGLTTMLITNGSALTENLLSDLHGKLDWVSISIDSLNSQTNKRIGRVFKGISPNDKFYSEKARLIKKYGMRLKINTVVSSVNYSERFSDFINFVKPERWKVFQVQQIENVNRKPGEEFFIKENLFDQFIKLNSNVQVPLIPEKNDDMIDSYVMIDPFGRLYGNSNRVQTYSKPLYEYPLEKALSEQGFSHKKFLKRHGYYDWDKNRGSSISNRNKLHYLLFKIKPLLKLLQIN